MVSEHRTYLKWATASLVTAGYLALASVSAIGPAILLIPLLFLSLAAYGERLDQRYPSYSVLTRAITIAYFCFLPLTLINMHLLPAVVTLAIYIQCYTLVHKKNVRNYYHLYLMSLFLLLAACVQSPEPFIGFVMLLFLISAVWANVMLRIVVEEEGLEKPVMVEYVSLDYLARQGRAGTAAGHRRAVPAMAGLLTLAVMLITAATFVLTPRMEAGILGRGETVIETTGLSDSIDLDASGMITQDDTPVMMVRFPQEPGGQLANEDWLYWRVTTLNVYEGSRWSSDDVMLLDPGIRALSNNRRPDQGAHGVERNMRTGAKLVYQSIYMDEVPHMGVPALDLVQRVEVDQDIRGVELMWSNNRDYTVRLNKVGSRRLNYEVWSEPGEPDPQDLRSAPMVFDGVGAGDYQLLTDQNLTDPSRQLAAQLTDPHDTLYDKVRAIEEFLSGPQFLYTLNVPEVESGPVIDAFLHQSRMGHCELFATAMALMVRSIGVPARVVSGFRGGEWNDSDQTYTIRANMAHLWVEVWFPGYGWIKFDPSPQGDDVELSGMDRMKLLVSRAILKSKMFWFQEVVGFDRGAQIERLRNFTLGIAGAFRGGAESSASRSAGSESWAGVLVSLTAVALLIAGGFVTLLRVPWVRVPRGLQLTADQIRLVRLYLLLRRRLQHFGVSCAGRTAEDIGRELRTDRWGAPAEALQVLELYNAVRFGGQPLNGANLAGLRKAIMQLRPSELP